MMNLILYYLDPYKKYHLYPININLYHKQIFIINIYLYINK